MTSFRSLVAAALTLVGCLQLPVPSSPDAGDGGSGGGGGGGDATATGGGGGEASGGGAGVVIPTTLAQQAYLKASNPGRDDSFGSALALSLDGLTLAVGVLAEDSATVGVNGTPNELATDSGAVYLYRRAVSGAWAQEAFVKASNTGAGDFFGWAVALSADGTLLAVGALSEDSSGAQADNSLSLAGAVYLFQRVAGAWSQVAYLKAPTPTYGAVFGAALALSSSGNTLAVSARGEDGARGSVYLFARNGAAWTQTARLQASNGDPNDKFGMSVALSGDALTLAVGASWEDSASRTIGQAQANDLAPQAGAAYVFVSGANGVWSQQAYLKADNADSNDFFGETIAISGDGNAVAVGAPQEDSAATGLDGDRWDNSAEAAGAGYTFIRTGTTWAQDGYLKAINTQGGDFLGQALALSSDGTTFAMGSRYEASSGRGVNPASVFDNQVLGSGAVYVFRRPVGGPWAFEAFVKASNPEMSDGLGECVVLSGTGDTLVSSATSEDGASAGLNGNQANNSLANSGAVYVFTR